MYSCTSKVKTNIHLVCQKQIRIALCWVKLRLYWV